MGVRNKHLISLEIKTEDWEEERKRGRDAEKMVHCASSQRANSTFVVVSSHVAFYGVESGKIHVHN